MGKITINVKNDIVSDVYAIIIGARLLFSDVYLANGYIPVTQSYEGEFKTIVFPEFDLNSINNFWNLAKEHKLGTVPSNNVLVDEVTNNLVNLNLDYLQKKLEITNFIDTHEDNIVKQLIKFEPRLKDVDINFDIYPKHFGAPIDFNSPEVNLNNSYYLAIRNDISINKLISAFLSTILSFDLNKTYSWREKKAIIDFVSKTILEELGIQCVEPGILGELDRNSISKELINNSEEFYRKYSFKREHVIYVENDEIYIYEEPLSSNFTVVDKEIIKQLLIKENHSLTYDEIADILWKDEVNEKYSLQGLNKRIERLRHKLYLQGVPKSTLINLRGEGYYLHN